MLKDRAEKSIQLLMGEVVNEMCLIREDLSKNNDKKLYQEFTKLSYHIQQNCTSTLSLIQNEKKKLLVVYEVFK